MKNPAPYNPFIAIAFALFLIIPFGCFAQKDSTRQDTIRKEYHDPSDFYLQRREKYDELTRARIEEKSMFKLALAYNDFIPAQSIAGFTAGYEKKLSPDFSIQGEIGYGIPIEFERYSTVPVVNASIAGRYYYNLRERIWEGRGANNLSANYFSFQVSDYALNRNIPFADCLFGIQRRLGKLFFFDVNGGLAFELVKEGGIPALTLNARIGFGL